MSPQQAMSSLGRSVVILVLATAPGLLLAGCGGDQMTVETGESPADPAGSHADADISSSTSARSLPDGSDESTVPASSSTEAGSTGVHRGEDSEETSVEAGGSVVTEETTDEHESTDEGTKKDDDLPGGADPAPRFFSLDTPSGRYSIAVGGSATLELPGDLPRPELTGTSVELIDMAAFAPTGTNQWEIRGKEGGTSEIRVGVDGPRWELVVP